MKKLVIFILLFVHHLTFSQTTILSGKIIDSKDKSPLIGVNISVNSSYGTASDFNGEYTIELNNGENAINFQYIGYETQKLIIDAESGQNYIKNISLNSTSTEMDLVVVSAGKFEQKLEEVTVSMDVIKPSLIENKNSTDLEVLMNQSPGVQVVDGQANIRGGSGWSYNTGSRVLVMIDDMPLLSGDRGTVNWNMIPMENISQIEVIKGASSVLFGSSAMNGVINVRTAYPKGEPETKVALFSGIYDRPSRDGLHWWGDDTRSFQGMSFSYAQQKNNTGIVFGGNIYSNDGYRGGYVTNTESSKFPGALPVSEKWARFNFNSHHNSKKISGLSYGLNANVTYLHQFQSLIFQNDEIGYTPIGVPDGSKPALFTQFMLNVDPFIKFRNTNNNTLHSYKSRFYRDNHAPFLSERAFSDVVFQEYQFQKTRPEYKFKKPNRKQVFTIGLASNYVKGDYKDVYGHDMIYNGQLQEYTAIDAPEIKQLFNYSLYGQYDLKFNKLNVSLGTRLEHFNSYKDNYLVPVIRSGINYQLLKGTFLRSSFGQGYRYPTIMEMFVETDYDPMYIYPNPDLDPESGWSAELGIKQLIKIGEWKGMIDLAGFIMHYDDMIEFSFGNWGAPTDGLVGFGFKCINIGATEISGFEFSLMGEGKIGIVDVTLLGSYTKVNPIILDPEASYGKFYVLGIENDINYINSSYDQSGVLKYRHENILKFDVNLDYKRIMTGLSFRYNSLMRNMDLVFGSDQFNGGSGPGAVDIGILDSRERMLNGDKIIDFRIGYHINDELTFSLIVDNLLNREYQHRPADLGPPRAFTIKLNAKI